MNIPINVNVFCRSPQNTVCGHTVAVILNPEMDVVTHIIVQEKGAPHTQRIVPFDLIQSSSPQEIYLSCDQAAFHELRSFNSVEYHLVTVPHMVMAFDGACYMEPLLEYEKAEVAVHQRDIPPHELSIERGAQVYSSDEHPIGRVDEFLVTPTDGHVTHLVLREGHLWSPKDVSIPIAEIGRMEEHDIYLKLNKKQIGELPTIPVRRKKVLS